MIWLNFSGIVGIINFCKGLEKHLDVLVLDGDFSVLHSLGINIISLIKHHLKNSQYLNIDPQIRL
jgi:hypothetical protein